MSLLNKPLLDNNDNNNDIVINNKINNNLSDHDHENHKIISKYIIDPLIINKFTHEEIILMISNFSKFDINGDGHIDMEELSLIMDTIGEKYTKEELKLLILDADTDGDNYVSFNEFVNLILHTKTNKTSSKLLEVIKLASSRELPSKYARLQTTRVMFHTNSDEVVEQDQAVINAVRASWFVNICLLFIKMYCYYISSSKAVLASLADSIVDLISQGILSFGDHFGNIPDPEFPVGRSRIECLSVMGSATIMIVASVEVVQCNYLFIYLFITAIN